MQGSGTFVLSQADMPSMGLSLFSPRPQSESAALPSSPAGPAFLSVRLQSAHSFLSARWSLVQEPL